MFSIHPEHRTLPLFTVVAPASDALGQSADWTFSRFFFLWQILVRVNKLQCKMPLGLQGLQPHILTVLFKSLPMVNLSIQHCNRTVLAEKPFTCVGIMEPSRKCRLILSRGALSWSSSPLLVTQSPWEVKEHTWYKHSDQVTIRSVLALSLTESHRVIVVPQSLREVTIHVVHSRIQHWCHQQTLPPHELLVDAVGFHVFGKPFEYVKLCTPETHGIHENLCF